MDKSKRLVLVTGGTGYVGSVLVPHLVRQGFNVRVYCSAAFGNSLPVLSHLEVIRGDIRDTDAVQKALIDVTDVVHLAGIVTDELVDMNPALAQEINVTAMNDLCRLSKDAGVRRFIYASSSSVYGAVDKPANEAQTPHPFSAYAQMKLDGESILRKYLSADFRSCSIRSATACGPAPRMRLDTIVNVFCKQAFFDGVITVFGGDQWRTNIHVMDVAKLYAFLLDARLYGVNWQVFNATCSNHQAWELASMVKATLQDVVDRPCEIVIDGTKSDPRSYLMDASKLRHVLGWTPQYSIKDAITDNFRFFENGGIQNPNDDVYYNNRRMAELMKGV